MLRGKAPRSKTALDRHASPLPWQWLEGGRASAHNQTFPTQSPCASAQTHLSTGYNQPHHLHSLGWVGSPEEEEEERSLC